ncbi:hypothetical protein R1H25_05655 [Stenotrophomonas sp. C2852]|uniref:hypothetical protein n=1 Tax=Stenotrophomonas sp. C2852 TaxID=3077845 RepID=UPI00293C3F5C|nr:hypothetical protein [Stenotrophomonas sp. C2852]MDV3434934.1 hypothetical protein [Stenotrophomonas sp. C2852]HEL2957212.1 hypothetical protein [Stenotrophomonas maltophilia]
MLHENNALGLFLYAWGYKDAEVGRVGARLLATAQSFLDHLIGDLIGQGEEGRWFLMEFKRERRGFFEEAHKKPARKNLMDALWANHDLAELSAYAHFACWLQGDDITIQQYVVATDDARVDGYPPHRMPFVRGSLGFGRAYEYLTEADATPFPHRSEDLFSHGTGVTGEGMRKYLAAVLAAHDHNVDPGVEVNALLGFTPSSGKPVVLVPTNFGGLLEAFERALRTSAAATGHELSKSQASESSEG